MASDKGKTKKNSFINYLQASVEELRKVTWPTRNQAIRLTFLVLGFCMVIALIIGILDFAFGFGYRTLLEFGPERQLPTAVTEQADGTLDGGAMTTTDSGDAVDTVEVRLGEEESVDGAAGIDVTAEPADTVEITDAETEQPAAEVASVDSTPDSDATTETTTE